MYMTCYFYKTVLGQQPFLSQNGDTHTHARTPIRTKALNIHMKFTHLAGVDNALVAGALPAPRGLRRDVPAEDGSVFFTHL